MRKPPFPMSGFPHAAGSAVDRLTELTDFGADPGNLRARLHIPAGLRARAPLVVVLHGCTQTAAGYDAGSGWSQLADRHGFALLYPEQRRANNPNGCFNWFVPGDIRRDGGEVASIRAMIETTIRRHDIDPTRVFVTGLSAGGAMTMAMLATCPEVFAGGAVVAGLPYGCASTVPEAMATMRTRTGRRGAALAAPVRAASAHAGPWPTLSVWHGGADATVDPGNADAILEQWRALHGLPDAPSLTETVDGVPRRVWRDAAGRAVIEDYRIAGMGHGTPLATRGVDGCGRAGAFMIEAGISSTRRIAEFWGIAADRPAQAHEPAPAVASGPLPAVRTVRAIPIPPADRAAPAATDIGGIIEKALRAAGLMR